MANNNIVNAIRVAATVSMSVLIATSGALSVSAEPNTKPAHTSFPDRSVVKETPTGVLVRVGLRKPQVDVYPPLDSSPFSREAFLSMTGAVALGGNAKEIAKSKTSLDVGYQIGYPVTVAKDGVKVGLVTPNLTVNAGLTPEVGVGANAGVTPKAGVDGSVTGGGGTSGGNGSGTVGGNAGVEVPLGVNGSAKVGADLGAKSDIIPSQKFDFTIGHGEIKEVSLSKFDVKKSDAILEVGGTEVSVTATAGRVSIRPYVRATIETDRGRITTVVYGDVHYL
ncbi:MspA family protein OS=Tsukamurella paurometabola (strain ATCC 8368 / DSM / CCUG 35730 / CIP 100753 / JCM 10117 / KCTC 9821 / NBRC 16120 / NCIMB 702349/ NCTC 13040) OX=521096 GN=Tpau_1505 PE=4 SV=1 [Tsukamurella paurometabola]|uniref:MspA family protein n=1 Tax=Tsukamurella paurometabola (strain ATCC 8368 / DSM 20162 / CCUG 35730 / CIP 100753 / JCM 10117 / KCTC 9821 / NBRC 16120 / NCIMB 702349 / NCTC 13040) TaxID=521096 RepID=D5UXN7_TSUPD|nr:MspA family porin [Tsukamurella paurometabola]ADG78129.1 MspA family protein [Tsukamurella paurometabola DSM 20162]SUP30322.1 MspA [Tsukamurella paurometabola]